MNLKEIRAGFGYSQEELAAVLREEVDERIDKSLVCKIEKGVCEPSQAMWEWCCNTENLLKSAGKIESGVIHQSDREDAIKRAIYGELLKHSSVRPASRGDLVLATGETDRVIREMIKQMRKDGMPICSASGKYGYWIGNDQDRAIFVREMKKRLKDIAETVRAFERMPMDDQIKVMIWDDTQL